MPAEVVTVTVRSPGPGGASHSGISMLVIDAARSTFLPSTSVAAAVAAAVPFPSAHCCAAASAAASVPVTTCRF